MAHNCPCFTWTYWPRRILKHRWHCTRMLCQLWDSRERLCHHCSLHKSRRENLTLMLDPDKLEKLVKLPYYSRFRTILIFVHTEIENFNKEFAKKMSLTTSAIVPNVTRLTHEIHDGASIWKSSREAGLLVCPSYKVNATEESLVATGMSQK